MENNRFTWHDRKAATNARDHGITFEAACNVFNDPFAVEWADERERYDEDRYIVLGMVEGRLLYVAYTMRQDKIRLISARKAEPHERRIYHEENRS